MENYEKNNKNFSSRKNFAFLVEWDVVSGEICPRITHSSQVWLVMVGISTTTSASANELAFSVEKHIQRTFQQGNIYGIAEFRQMVQFQMTTSFVGDSDNKRHRISSGNPEADNKSTSAKLR